MKVHYLKMHGAGNRILVVDQRRNALPPPDGSRVRELAAAPDGPGFDQLMWVSAAEPPFAASYRIFNADGSEVRQCGNGVRCVARVLANEPGHDQAFTLLSPAGPIEARVATDGLVTVSMGRPEFEPGRIPFAAASEAMLYPLEVDGRRIEIAAVSMGNPHCVLQVEDIAEAPVVTLGPALERHERFPERVNVGFMQIIDRSHVALRVFERGVGETLACGTGACAAVVTGRKRGLLDPDVTVKLPGGELVVSWRGEAEPVWLTGNAELVSEGSMDL